MGHNGSKAGNLKNQLPLESEHQWAHSYPRNRFKHFQHKVLPAETITRKLKTTNNGEILQSGGTLTGRQHSQTLPLDREGRSFKIFRTNSSSSSPSDQYDDDGPSSFHIPQHWSDYRYIPNRYEQKQLQKEQMKKFGSEPDLRNPISSNQNAGDKYKAKKKYKAPAPPNSNMLGKSNISGQWNSNGEMDPVIKQPHTRLYKTKTELSQKSSPLKSKYSRDILEWKNDEFQNSINVNLRNGATESTYNRLSLPEMRRIASVPDFQLELKETIQRIRNEKIEKEDMCEIQSNVSDKISRNQPTTFDHNTGLQLKLSDTDNHKIGKESSLPEKTQVEIQKETPAKTFYFGMEQKQNGIDSVVDHFASTFLPYNYNTANLESDISSELEMDESQVSSSEIALQLRPILPKKQLEIPRFSPAVAWKLLSAVESNFGESTVASDEGPVFVEDKIEKFSRPPPPLILQGGPRSNYDKSGDSGISGDAGPPGFDDSPEVPLIDIRNNLQLPSGFNRSQGISWTPQQDLGEDESSTDDELQKTTNQCDPVPVKFSPRSNIFSLSLPRENHLSTYLTNRNMPQSYVGLQKLKRSVSGVLNGLNNKKDIQVNVQDQNENWFLSKSAPNSLNNGFNSLDLKNPRKIEEIDRPGQNMSRVMYLPESRLAKKDGVYKRIKSREEYKCRSQSTERTQQTNLRRQAISKSCENISITSRPAPERASLQDPPSNKDLKISYQKPKRFTFQSTIRQIERKRLAEKLSREAEKKEKQRLSELAAMQKVEEEFQKKRAREKASIRQQLRLFSLDDTSDSWTSLPAQIEIKDEITTRSEPDGAISSSTSTVSLPLDENKRKQGKTAELRPQRKLSPASDSSEETKKTPMTQILSEYRQPQREYKDFRSSPRLMGDFNDTSYPKHTTIHPQITCDMPKVTAHQGSGGDAQGFNYRKQFAHGVKTNRSGGSSYSDDSQRNVSPKAHLRKTSISRF